MYEVDCKELKKLMIDHDIATNTAFAELTGVNRDTIAKILDGKLFPTYKVIADIAKAMKMDSQQIGSIFFKQKVTQDETLEGVTQ
jgi:DNA-binding XRE family transcriptional regulator